MSEPKTLLKYPEPKSQVSFPLFKTEGEKPKGTVEKFLSMFADVRAGEGVTALLMGLNAFLILMGYYLLKSVRNGLILTEAGAESEAYLSGAQAILLTGVIPLYGWIGGRVNRLKLVAGANLFFAANLAVFVAVGRGDVHVGKVFASAFFVWVGIFNVFVISQFWAFANDIYTEGQGRRLFPMIGVGSTVGAIAGSKMAGSLTNGSHSPYELMLWCAVALLACIAILLAVNRRESRKEDAGSSREAEEPLGREGGFQLLMRDRYLLWIAVLTVALNLVNKSGEYMFNALLKHESLLRFGADKAAQLQFTTALTADYQFWYNVAALLLQLLVVSRLMRYAGVRASLFVLPCISLAGYSAAAALPVLALIRVLKVAENSVDYTLQSTVSQALFLPTSREAKYKAKAAIDTFCKRFGDVITAAMVFAVQQSGAGLRAMCGITVLLTLVWLWSVTRVAREHRKLTV